jgi:hypothetical protein
MDTDKIKIFGARVKVDGTGKLAELERAEKVSPISYSFGVFGVFLSLTFFVSLRVFSRASG